MPLPEILDCWDPLRLAAFDDIIDVRSPAEFAEDHLPGAINLPVLSDSERAVVGTIYVQESTFRARRIGAALVAHNIAQHLDTALADRPVNYRPLVYCWRGGQRSNAMATVLGQVGWRTFVLSGGYKTYRRRVQRRLYDVPLGLDLVRLDGGTGTGKTDVLLALARLGVQTLDLEALAEHRGSLFGGRPGIVQPKQKMFESRLLAKLEGFDPTRPVVVEAESHKVGDRMMPPALWRAMAEAPRIVLDAPRLARAQYLAANYTELSADQEMLKAIISRLPVHISGKQVEALHAYVDLSDFVGLAESLIELHYDPAYARAARTDPATMLGHIELKRIDRSVIDSAAVQIADLLGAWVPK